MDEKERVKIKELISKGWAKNKLSISFDNAEYLRFINVTPENIGDHVQLILSKAYFEKNAEDLEYALLIAVFFQIECTFPDILSQLIIERWHFKHEDIAKTLQEIRSPDTVDSICQAIIIAPELEYLNYRNGESLITKCMWALNDIDTPHAKEKIKAFSTSDNELIRNAALKRINKWSLS